MHVGEGVPATVIHFSVGLLLLLLNLFVGWKRGERLRGFQLFDDCRFGKMGHSLSPQVKQHFREVINYLLLIQLK